MPRGSEGQGGGLVAKASPGRYQGLEQRLEAELQAAATSKEEALMKLKSRALKLEEELLQVRLPGSRDPPVPSAGPQSTSRLLAPGSLMSCLPHILPGLLEGALLGESGGWVAVSRSGLLDSSNGPNFC